MATSADFKKLAKSRLKTSKLLMNNKEWGVAAYMLGFVLECILKSTACKSLNLANYPEVGKGRQEISSYFCTHNYDMLLVVSGLTDILGFSGIGADSWSGFTQEYSKLGHSWTFIRYETLQIFDKKKVLNLYKFLTNSKDGIITLVEKEKRW